jgi:hypothetical protein
VKCEKVLQIYAETQEIIRIETSTSPAVVSVESPNHTYLCSIRALTSDGGYGFSSHINFSLPKNMDSDDPSYADDDDVDDINGKSSGNTRVNENCGNHQ